MKIIFAGTPQFALLPLSAMIEAGFEVCAVLTQPDKPQGRRGVLTPSPVKAFAIEKNIPVLQPQKLKEDVRSLASVGADLMVTCAYGQILTQEILDLFPMGVWNIHASLLPFYRGAAPIARCIMEGETQTGVTIMKTDVGLDTGDILSQKTVEITREDTCGSLSEKLSALGATAIVEALSRIRTGDFTLEKQGEGFVCKKVQRTQVDFTQSAEAVANLINGLSPAPLAYSKCNGIALNFYGAIAVDVPEEGEAGEVLSDLPKRGLLIKCGSGVVKITFLQPAGGKKMDATSFLNGRKIQKGMRFENEPIL